MQNTTSTPSPAQIAYATKLRDNLAASANFPITDTTIWAMRRSSLALLGFASRRQFVAAYPDTAQARAVLDTITDEQILADAQQRAKALRARQAELGAADIWSMTRAEISAYIDAARNA